MKILRPAILTLACLLFTMSPAFAQDVSGQHPYTQDMPQPWTIDEILNSASFVSEGKTYRLWGLIPLEEEHPNYNGGKAFLESLLKFKTLKCEPVDDEYHKCHILGRDLGAMIAESGFAKSAGDSYATEQAKAQKMELGKWGDACPVEEETE